MFIVFQSTTMPYNMCQNAPTDRLNHTLIDLLVTTKGAAGQMAIRSTIASICI